MRADQGGRRLLYGLQELGRSKRSELAAGYGEPMPRHHRQSPMQPAGLAVPAHVRQTVIDLFPLRGIVSLDQFSFLLGLHIHLRFNPRDVAGVVAFLVSRRAALAVERRKPARGGL